MHISGHTTPYAVLGHPIGHTLSPPMHNASLQALGMDAVYLAFDVHPDALMSTLLSMGAMGFRGVNLTIPHKEVAFRGIPQLDASARLVGGVNTVQFTEDGLVGHSTDGYGFLRDMDEQFGFSPTRKTVCVQGVGGAGRAIALVTASEGASHIILNSRNAEARAQVEREIQALDLGTRVSHEGDPHDADLVVNGTPVGMKDGDPSLIEQNHFHAGQIVYDLIYVKPLTPFLEPAQAAGARVANGIGMLLHQGVRSFEIWTGKSPDVPAMRQALERFVYAG